MKIDSVIFFDGICNLCNGAVQFIIERDEKNIFKFAPLQSDFAAQELITFNFNPNQLGSILLLENGKIYTKSTAALRISKKLNGLWPMMYAFIVVPRFIRDAVYDFIAKNRYKWFGKQESCWVPTAELKSKFLG